MEYLDIKNITYSWGIKLKDFKKLSEFATLIITDDENRYVLKKKMSLKQFESELKLLKHFKINKFATQIPLINKSDDFIISYNSDYYCIYHYLDGETFRAVESLRNPIVAKLLGETIAKLNIIMESVKFPEEFPKKDLYQMVYGFAVNEIRKVDSSERLFNIYQQLEDEIKTVVSSLSKQLVHRDAHIHNIVFNDGILSGVIDFEIAEINVNIFDICYCSTSVLSEVFSNETFKEDWLIFVGDLVDSYHLWKPLTINEKKSIWYIMLCIQSIFMSYFSNNKAIYEINKAMFLWIYENRKNIESKIL